MTPIFRCSGEVIEVSNDGGKTWKYVADCTTSLDELMIRMLNESGVEYGLASQDQ